MLSSLWVVGIDELMTPYEALAHAFATMPTGGFSTQPDSAAAFSAASSGSSRSSWLSRARTSLSCTARSSAGAHAFSLRRGVPPLPRARRVASVALTSMLWAYGSPRARPRSARRLPDVSILTTTGLATPTSRSGRRCSCSRSSRSCSSAGRRARRRLDQGRPPPAPRQDPAREVDQTLSPEVVMPIRLNGTPVDERTVRAIAAFILLYVGFWAVGASVIAIDSAISASASGRSTRSARPRRPRQRRPRVRDHRAVRLVRRLRRRVEDHDDRPHVGRRLEIVPVVVSSPGTTGACEPSAASARRGARAADPRPRPVGTTRAPDRPAARRSTARRAPSGPGATRR